MDLFVKTMEIRQSTISQVQSPFFFLMPQVSKILRRLKRLKNRETVESVSGFLQPTSDKMRAIERPSFGWIVLCDAYYFT